MKVVRRHFLAANFDADCGGNSFMTGEQPRDHIDFFAVVKNVTTTHFDIFELRFTSDTFLTLRTAFSVLVYSQSILSWLLENAVTKQCSNSLPCF